MARTRKLIEARGYQVIYGDTDSTFGPKGERRQGPPVFIRADKQVPCQELMTLMDALRAAGYLKVALVGLQPSQG